MPLAKAREGSVMTHPERPEECPANHRADRGRDEPRAEVRVPRIRMAMVGPEAVADGRRDPSSNEAGPEVPSLDLTGDARFKSRLD